MEATLTYLDSEDVTVVVDGTWQADNVNNNRGTFQVTQHGICVNTFDGNSDIVNVLWLPWSRVLSLETDAEIPYDPAVMNWL